MPDDQKVIESGTLQAFGWLATIAERAQQGMLVPIVSSGVADDLALGEYPELEKAYAEKYVRQSITRLSVPQEGVPQGNLAELTQFASIINETFKDQPLVAVKDAYINFIRDRLCERAKNAGIADDDRIKEAKKQTTLSKCHEVLRFPDFGDSVNSHNPLYILASFDLPIFITTSYHGFLESALRSLGKKPRTDFCRWNKALREKLPKNILEGLPKGIDPDYDPSPDEPLVYHLRGYDGFKDSLALTEDEHLHVLLACSEFGPPGSILDSVKIALSLRPLIVLGYNLRSWEFRAVLWGLIRSRSDKTQKGVSIQIKTSDADRQYFAKYMKSPEIELTAYWGTVDEYLDAIRKAVT